MSFRHVTLSVKDMDVSVRFYTEIVELPVDKRYSAGPDTEITFLGAGATKVELICRGNQASIVAGNGISIGFDVKDLPEKLDSLKKTGVPVVSDIIQPNPHVRFFYVTDPDGYRVQFIEDI